MFVDFSGYNAEAAKEAAEVWCATAWGVTLADGPFPFGDLIYLIGCILLVSEAAENSESINITSYPVQSSGGVNVTTSPSVVVSLGSKIMTTPTIQTTTVDSLEWLPENYMDYEYVILADGTKIKPESLPLIGEPDSYQDLYDHNGELKQRRFYDPDGKAIKDIDYKHSGEGHVFPHNHFWRWIGDKAIRLME